MQNHLQFIQDFSDTISNIFKKLALLCRQHSQNINQTRPELVKIHNQLLIERARRMELEEVVRQRMTATPEVGRLESSQDEIRRPRTAFLLYVSEQRQKILREHPTLDLHKISTLAALKWKKLNKQQQQVYEKKLEEMNKIPEEELIRARARQQQNNDACYVKREYDAENENENNTNQEHQNNHEKNSRQNEEQDHPHEMINQEEQIPSQPQPENNVNSQIQTTQMIENQYENQATLQMEEQIPQEKGAIENMRDLFHTQLLSKQQNNEQKTLGHEQRLDGDGIKPVPIEHLPCASDAQDEANSQEFAAVNSEIIKGDMSSGN